MWKVLVWGAVITVAGCGKKADECQQVFDKLAPVLKELMGDKAKDFDKEQDKQLEKCRKEPKAREDATFKCVLAAADRDAVKKCLTAGIGDYQKKSKASEASVRLNQISKSAKRVFGETGAFPKGTAKPLPDAPGGTAGGGCCGGKSDGTTVDNKCPASKAWADDPVWKQLDVSVDEPGSYRYSYTSSDGKSFKATAVGDLDCDGKEATYELSGSVDASGNPTTSLVNPPPGVY